MRRKIPSSSFAFTLHDRAHVERERNCLVLVSGMSGALTVARATADPGLRKTILEAAKEFYIKEFCE